MKHVGIACELGGVRSALQRLPMVLTSLRPSLRLNSAHHLTGSGGEEAALLVHVCNAVSPGGVRHGSSPTHWAWSFSPWFY